VTHTLSKSQFIAGWQCPKLLWWRVHEPDAKELQPGVVLQDLFDQGKLVDLRARNEWPDGVLIERADSDATRTVLTRTAIDAGARVIFGAAFEADGVYCIVDVLERNDDGWTLIEVKSASSVKEYHLPDVAVQVHVARRAGLNVTRAEVMHLNREHRHPDTGPLFARTDVSAEIRYAAGSRSQDSRTAACAERIPAGPSRGQALLAARRVRVLRPLLAR
jgi:hypothetical protein